MSSMPSAENNVMMLMLQIEYAARNKKLKTQEIELRKKLETLMAPVRAAQFRRGGANIYSADTAKLSQSFTENQLKTEDLRGPPQIVTSRTENNDIFVPQLDYSQFKSCTCTQDAKGGGGFFGYLCSFLGSSKPQTPAAGGTTSPKDSTPAAPQEAPTKDIKHQQNPESQNMQNKDKSEHCTCNPRVVDLPEDNIPQNNGRGSKFRGIGDACNCSICSRANLSDPCPCSFLEDNVEDSCNTKPNNTNMYGGANYNGRPGGGSASFNSLNSQDLHNMQDVHALAVDHKQLVKDVTNLEQQVKIYQNVFAEYKNTDFSSRPAEQDVFAEYKNTDFSSQLAEHKQAQAGAEQKTSAELKLENLLLKNELKDMRLEVRQYLERMEGPMQFKIESERFKCQQIEQKLEDTLKGIKNTTDQHNKELNNLNVQLFKANESAYNSSVENEAMKKELLQSVQKCAKLEEDLIRQKISEAETIKSLQAALSAQVGAGVDQEECNLHDIARELSKVLKECEPCGECMNLPEDLTTAAKLLKSLTDMVEFKLNKAEEDLNDFMGAAPRTDGKQTTDSFQDKKSPHEIEPEASKTSKASSGKQEIHSVITQSLAYSEKGQLEGKPSPKEDTHSKRESIKSQLEEKPSPKEDTNNRRESIKSTGKAESTSIKSEPKIVDNHSKVSSKKSNDSGKGEQLSEQDTRNEKDEKINENPTVEDILSRPKPKMSCKCVQTKRSAEVNQLWPKTDKPVEFKDSVPETQVASSKQKCDCSIARKLREIANQQRKFENELVGKASTPTNKDLCKCSKKGHVSIHGIDKEQKGQSKPQNRSVDQLWPKGSERFRLSHQVTASKSQDLLTSETSVKCLKVKENFPFDVDTQVDIINKRPEGVHVTTTITDSGTLEVITEGPEGVIETTLIYTTSGNVEVVTEILEYQGKKIKGCKPKGKQLQAIEGPENISLKNDEIKPKETPAGAKLESMKSSCLCRDCPGLEKAKDMDKACSKEKVTKPPSEPAQKPQDTESPEEPQTSEPAQKPQDTESPEEPQTSEPTQKPQDTESPEEPQTSEPTQKSLDTIIIDDQPPRAEQKSNIILDDSVPEHTGNAPDQVDETLLSIEPSVVKTLSLSLHAEDENDLTVTTEAIDNQPKEE